jgi:hypothetical protein
MIAAIMNINAVIIRHIDMVKACHINPEFRWITPPSMMSINTAITAKIMFRNSRMELIER